MKYKLLRYCTLVFWFLFKWLIMSWWWPCSQVLDKQNYGFSYNLTYIFNLEKLSLKGTFFFPLLLNMTLWEDFSPLLTLLNLLKWYFSIVLHCFILFGRISLYLIQKDGPLTLFLNHLSSFYSNYCNICGKTF